MLGLSIFFQNANTYSSYASGSFAVGCIYVLAFVTVFLILLRNAKNETERSAQRFFGKIEILRYDYKDSKWGRAAPLVFTVTNMAIAIFTGVVQASGQAQASMLVIFPTFAIIYWALTKGLVKKGELILMIFSETCFAIAGLLHGVLSNPDITFNGRLTVGWVLMGTYLIMIWGNMVYRFYELFILIRKLCSAKKKSKEKKSLQRTSFRRDDVKKDIHKELDTTRKDDDVSVESGELHNIQLNREISMKQGFLNSNLAQGSPSVKPILKSSKVQREQVEPQSRSQNQSQNRSQNRRQHRKQSQDPILPLTHEESFESNSQDQGPYSPIRHHLSHFRSDPIQQDTTQNQLSLGKTRQRSSSPEQQAQSLKFKNLPKLEENQVKINISAQLSMNTQQQSPSRSRANAKTQSQQYQNQDPQQQSQKEELQPQKQSRRPRKQNDQNEEQSPNKSGTSGDVPKKKPEPRKFVIIGNNKQSEGGQIFKRIVGEKPEQN